MNILSIIGRKSELFSSDINAMGSFLDREVSSSRFLIIGGAGSIGLSVSREIFKRDPRLLHVVDISENNLVELVRDFRSTFGYGTGG
jgi:FlaA1/EpsC-like NDP-sugar epimerase